jgi:FdhD protein
MKDTAPVTIRRLQRGAVARDDRDDLVVEEPLEIRVDGRSVSVTMRTPGHDDELAAGFLLSEGLVKGRADIREVAPEWMRDDCNIVDVHLAEGVSFDFESLSRHVFASSSCGVCGKASIESVHLHFPPVESEARIGAETLLSLPARLGQGQAAFRRTGGLHAAAVFDLDGGLVVLREDVGRHNAVDKVLGHALLNGLLPFDRHVLLVSGRASFEIMQKALAGRVPIVAAVSAPSSLAVQFAEESGQTLIGFVRGERMNIYAGAERVPAHVPP